MSSWSRATVRPLARIRSPTASPRGRARRWNRPVRRRMRRRDRPSRRLPRRRRRLPAPQPRRLLARRQPRQLPTRPRPRRLPARELPRQPSSRWREAPVAGTPTATWGATRVLDTARCPWVSLTPFLTRRRRAPPPRSEHADVLKWCCLPAPPFFMLRRRLAPAPAPALPRLWSLRERRQWC